MHATMSLGHRRAASGRRRQPKNLLGLLATGLVCAALSGLMVTAFFFSREPAMVTGSINLGGSGGLAVAIKAVPLVGAQDIGADDPVSRFAQTRVGQLIYSSSKETCRRTLFDNRSGLSYDAGEVFCGQTPDQVIDAASPSRLNEMRRSFKK